MALFLGAVEGSTPLMRLLLTSRLWRGFCTAVFGGVGIAEIAGELGV
jgi:hypothetical protein